MFAQIKTPNFVCSSRRWKWRASASAAFLPLEPRRDINERWNEWRRWWSIRGITTKPSSATSRSLLRHSSSGGGFPTAEIARHNLSLPSWSIRASLRRTGSNLDRAIRGTEELRGQSGLCYLFRSIFSVIEHREWLSRAERRQWDRWCVKPRSDSQRNTNDRYQEVARIGRMHRSAGITRDCWIGVKDTGSVAGGGPQTRVGRYEVFACRQDLLEDLRVTRNRIQSAVSRPQWDGLHDEEEKVQILGGGRPRGAHGGAIRQCRAFRQAEAPGRRFLRWSFHQVSLTLRWYCINE